MAFFNWSINLTPEAIRDLILAAVLLVVAIVTIIMIWHWKKYSIGSKTMALAQIIYLVGAAILVGIAFLNS